MKKFIAFLVAITLIYACSSSSDENSNSTTTVVPLAPTSLTGTIVSPTQINLSWTDNSTNETGFKIQRRTASESYAIVGNANTDILTFSDPGLTPSTTYTYRVYSYNTLGNSPTYSNEVTITTTSNTADMNVPGPNVTDIDGNLYASISNCGQTWTKQNLNVSKYSDGTPIPQVQDPTQWVNLTTGAWCYYANTSSNGTTYGKLYNWYAVAGIYDAASRANPALRKKLAPMGWHVPTNAEWTQLTDCLGGAGVAGGKMKSTGTSLWQSPNLDATNTSGFTGVPGGILMQGFFFSIGSKGYYWSLSENDLYVAFLRVLGNDNGSAYESNNSKYYGLSVRCIKD